MKICVFSDSHGTAENMIEAVRRETPELCFFLGDGERDLTVLQERFPHLPINTVRGNCDLRSVQSLSLRCAVGGLSIYAVHGHQHEVKYDDMLRELLRAALRANDFLRADVAYLSWYALSVPLPGGVTLHEKLESAGVFSPDAYQSALTLVSSERL